MKDVWTDHNGKQWPRVKSSRRLKFKYPLHAAIRAYVFHRDGFKCRHCSAAASSIPAAYDGREALSTNTFVRSRGYGGRQWNDTLIVDHVLTLAAGGTNDVENMQTLCETCNKKKGGTVDRASREAYRNGR